MLKSKDRVKGDMGFMIFLLLFPILVFWGFNYHNMSLHFSLVLGMIALPFVTQLKSVKGNYRFAIAALLTSLVLVFFRSNSFFYFSSAFIAFFVLDKWWGRLNYLPVLLVGAISPIIGSIVYLWSFSIRMQLSQWAGSALQWIGMDIEVMGNVLTLDGTTFSVDPACIGLKLMITALVLGIIILAYFEKKSISPLPLWKALLLLGSVFIGTIFANFIRLLTLIIFYILPENPMHDVVGLLSLGVYVLLPFYFLVKWIYQKHQSGEQAIERIIGSAQTDRMRYPVLIFLLVFQLFTAQQFLEENVENIAAVQNIEIEGLEKEITKNGVLKLQSEEVLIYIKPPVPVFKGSHDPRYCWQGSGYTFSEVQLETIHDKHIYTAILSKGKDQFYTAWWYENTTTTTPYEWDWRWKTLRGESDFYMINVSCEKKDQLNNWLQQKMILGAQ